MEDNSKYRSVEHRMEEAMRNVQQDPDLWNEYVKNNTKAAMEVLVMEIKAYADQMEPEPLDAALTVVQDLSELQGKLLGDYSADELMEWEEIIASTLQDQN